MRTPSYSSSHSCSRHLLSLFFSLLLAGTLFAQNRNPHIGYVYPAGGRCGETTEVTIGGQYLTGLTNVFVSGEGIQAEIVKLIRPLKSDEKGKINVRMTGMQKKLKAERKKTKKNPAGDDLLACPPDIRDVDIESLSIKGLAKLRNRINDKRKQPNSQISDVALVRLTLDPKTAPGKRTIQLAAKAGLTNPMDIYVGQLPEVREQEPNDQAASGPAVKLPATLCGQVMPGDRDRFRFTATKGQSLVVIIQARTLIPYLADAVPGWFQATATLYDANGKEVAFVDDYKFHPDPVLHVDIPADGEYELEIRDAIYRGREDFVYRIDIGELPFVTSMFPLGGPAGKTTKATLTGWNLPRGRIKLEADDREPGRYTTVVRQQGYVTAPIPFAVDALPETTDKESNDDIKHAQRISDTSIVNGRIDEPGDWDVFRIQGKAGDTIVAEVHARRLNSPVDSFLRITDKEGAVLAENDDTVDKGAGLTTHHADSYLLTALPKDGTYYVHLGDTQNKGGGDYAYRLRIGSAQPDFRLRMVPATLNLRCGETALVTAYALRQDDMNSDIELSLVNANGFSLAGACIPSGQDSTRLTLTAPDDMDGEIVRLQWQGRASFKEQEMLRNAVAAEDQMQAFLYRHLVPMEDFIIGVIPSKYRRRLHATSDPVACLQMPTGSITFLDLPTWGKRTRKDIVLELDNPPVGITLKEVSHTPGKISLQLQADAAKIKPGTKGNLILNAVREYQPRNKEGKATGKKRRRPAGLLPAIPFEVVSSEPAAGPPAP